MSFSISNCCPCPRQNNQVVEIAPKNLNGVVPAAEDVATTLSAPLQIGMASFPEPPGSVAESYSQPINVLPEDALGLGFSEPPGSVAESNSQAINVLPEDVLDFTQRIVIEILSPEDSLSVHKASSRLKLGKEQLEDVQDKAFINLVANNGLNKQEIFDRIHHRLGSLKNLLKRCDTHLENGRDVQSKIVKSIRDSLNHTDARNLLTDNILKVVFGRPRNLIGKEDFHFFWIESSSSTYYETSHTPSPSNSEGSEPRTQAEIDELDLLMLQER